MYDARPITNGSLLRRLANRCTSVGQDYEMSDRHNCRGIVTADVLELGLSRGAIAARKLEGVNAGQGT